jgi:Fe2+ transport system protein FeoA
MGIPLTRLRRGNTAQVVALADDCQGLSRRRLLDLGITPGALVLVERANAGCSAVAYRIRQTLIALRREQADQILVLPLGA